MPLRLVFSLWLVTLGASCVRPPDLTQSSPPSPVPPSVIAPPARFGLDPYYTKFTWAREFPVVGRRASDAALLKANDTSRTKPYDNVFASACLAKRQVPTVVGASVYDAGLVIDTRLYTPLTDLAPAQVGDSEATGMQHMGVVKDFFIQP